ncbi:MAG: PAS domain-containing protein [Sandarakinorhabdus sp.]|nr:PAS domain-containing protein [Sandarakinorhabdus sp.]
MEGWGWQSVHDPDVLPDVMEGWTGAIASGAPFEMVFPLRGADGVFRPFLTRVVPVRDLEGNLRRWVGNNIDISEQVGIEIELRQSQKKLEEANRTLAEREAFLSSVLGSSTDCIKVLDLDGRLTFMSEGGQKVMEVTDFGTISGSPWPDFWQGQGNIEARAAIEAAKSGSSHSFVGRAETMAGNPRWWDVAVSPIRGSDGKPDGILSVSRDITASRENEEARDQLARIVENSADFIGMARLDGTVFFLNDAACRLVGFDRAAIATVTIADFFPPEEAEIVRDEVLPAVARDNFWSGERLFRHFGTDELIPVIYTVFPVTDHDGKRIGYATVTRDIRNRKRAEAQQQFLNDELSHRLKNVLAVVQSVASQTLRQADDLSSANIALAARLAALGQATDVLTAKAWTSADLRELVDRAFAPYGGVGERIRVAGPSLMLLPQVTLAFALALHELTTNAVKYGALSAPGGHVDLTWSITKGSNGEKPRFHLLWQEVGGPAVQAPIRRGFGSMMIERSLRSYFRGEAQLEFPTSGLVFTLDASLADAGSMVE